MSLTSVFWDHRYHRIRQFHGELDKAIQSQNHITQSLTSFMASEQHVKRYLAYWFQLGKKVLIRNGQVALQPKSILAGDRYSEEFEAVWQQILSPSSGDCYIEGTDQTIAELLTPAWDLTSCARCEMPIPIRNAGMPAEVCPCYDLPNWPNTDLPKPREPINTQDRLQEIRERLYKTRSSSSSN